MTKYVVFLRAVNVGGSGNIKMSELKAALEAHGFENVITYINSGNIILNSKENPAKTRETFKSILVKQFSLNNELILKSQGELENILAYDPYSPDEDEKSKRLVAMLSGKMDKNKPSIFRDDKNVTENFYLNDDVLYIYYANGAGKSKFTTSYIEKKLGIIATARNWNTLEKMLELMKQS